ncbi:hypothetical protein BDR04DRAFT_1117126 [Suillus decipiens]|nr:hypothetical protein BDR04DRAFT_1117126 [Suillus decipiens]
MEYSPDDIAEARSVQFLTFSVDGYILVLISTTYDVKWMFLLRSDWSKVKGLYIVTRYLPFIIIVTVLRKYFSPSENLGTCHVLTNVNSGLGITSVIFSECTYILFTRKTTYVLWNKNRILLAAMSFTSVAFLVVSFSSTFTATVPAAYETNTIPGITECYDNSTSSGWFIQFILLTVFELGLMILTLIRAIQSWRMKSSRLYVVLVKHNIFYYACGLLINIFTSLLLQYCYYDMFVEVMVLAILATRMHVHLWEMSRRAYDSGDPLQECQALQVYLLGAFVYEARSSELIDGVKRKDGHDNRMG